MFIGLAFSLGKHLNLLCKFVVFIIFQQFSRAFDTLSQFVFYRIDFNLHLININLEFP